MNEYFLVATPQIAPHNADGQRIESVVFIATNGFASHRWVVQNTGSLTTDLAYLVDAGTASRIMHRLCKGETVLFYETFTLEQLKSWMEDRGTGGLMNKN
jgi:hypothetical protein